MQKRIGFAGLGLMGSRMARQLLDKGWPLTVWNRTPERCSPLREAGAEVAATPRELAESCHIVVACVADPNAVGRIVFASLCDKLIDLDGKMGLVPQLATKWEWSADNMALTLTSRSRRSRGP